MEAGPLHHTNQVDKENANEGEDKTNGAPMGNENQRDKSDSGNRNHGRADEL
jgi:hypothetical protein